MTEVLLLHHVCGLTAGVLDLADRWRQAGHAVHAPDLFDGRTFTALEEGVAHVKALGGAEEQQRRASAVADGLSDRLVVAGISLGVPRAQALAARGGVVGAILLEAFVGPEWAGPWPDGLPLQVHGMDDDPFFAHEGDLAAARDLAGEREEVELFTYPGSAHLFTDSSLPSFDAAAAALVDDRVLGFLDRLDAP